MVELTPEGKAIAMRFMRDLEEQTRTLRVGWNGQREQLAAEVLNEISDALDAGKHGGRPKQRRWASRARGP